MSKKSLIVILTLTLSLISFLTFAEVPTETYKAMELVKKAKKHFEKVGKEQALKDFSNKEGGFVDGSLYVFAYDLNGTIIAHPHKAELIGKNLLDKPDSKGKLFRKEISELAKTKGEGWVDYYYWNPKTDKESLKSTYILKIDSVILCCGIYKKTCSK